jgi:chaperone BCS1
MVPVGGGVAGMLWVSYLLPIASAAFRELGSLLHALLFKTLVVAADAPAHVWVRHFVTVRATSTHTLRVVASRSAADRALPNDLDVATRLSGGRYYVRSGRLLVVASIGADEQDEPGDIRISCVAWNGLGALLGVLRVAREEYAARFSQAITMYSQDGVTFHNPGFKVHNYVFPRPLHTIVMSARTRRALVEGVRDFLDSRALYERVGRKYKMNVLLHGPPGTGKSSVVSTLCDMLGYSSVYLADLADAGVWARLNTVGARSVVLFEDLDRHFEPVRNVAGDVVDHKPAFCLPTMLNFLDGMKSADDVVAVVTVNNMSVVPEVLLRPGRVDLRVEMPRAGHEQAAEYARLFYPDLDAKTAAALARAACADGPVALSGLQQVFFRHRAAPLAALAELRGAPSDSRGKK